MSRNGSGVYSKPAGTTFVPNTVIESSRVNEVIDDIVADLNLARPVVAGGTGATTAAGARTNLGVDPARTFVTKSAGYTAVAADKAASIRFDGAYTLSLTAAATLGSGWYCYVQADGGAVTIDPNSSETINGSTTITIPDGTSTLVICDGTNFRALEDYATKQDAAALSFGQCYLNRSGSNLRLSRKNGRLITIDGVHYTIPSAGVDLAPTSLTPGTAYYIYAFINSGTMTLEASTTDPVENSTTGVWQKTGDASRTLVGLWLVVTGPAWSTVQVQGASYFNPVNKASPGAVATTTTTTSNSLAELSTDARLQYVTFADRPTRIEVMGRTGVSVATAETRVTASANGSGVLPNAIVNRMASTSGSQLNSFYGGNSLINSAGLYTASILAATTTGTGSFFDTQVIVTISG